MTLGPGGDVLRWLADELNDARAASAAAYEREAALDGLNDLALDVATRRREPVLSIEALFASPRSPEERARLESLTKRAIHEPEETTP